MKTTYIGMDLHATKSTLVWLDQNGNQSGRREVDTTVEQLQSAVEAIPGERKQLVFEQCSQATWAADVLADMVDELQVSDPRYNDRISKAACKNDHADAWRLAELLYLGKIHQLQMPTIDRRLVFRKQYIYYERQTREATRAVQKLISQLRYWGARIPTGEPYTASKAEQWIQQVSRPVRPNLQHLQQAAQLHTRHADQTWQQVTETAAGYPEIREFQKIFGIGQVGAHGLSAYIMDPHRFRTASQVYAYSKLAVRHHSSQGKRTRREKLIPAGHGSLKVITHRAVNAALRHPDPDNEVYQFYQASLGRSKSEKNARLNTQRKILKACWSLWKHNEPYRPKRFLGQTGQ